MRISWRPSGSEETPGRGEYEISEQFGQLAPSHLLGRRIILELGRGLVIDTRTVLTDQGGKRRLRRLDKKGIHLHRQFAAAMMMPRPARDAKSWGTGAPVMYNGRYTIAHIDLRSAQLAGTNQVQLAVEEAQLRNGSYHAELLHAQQRLSTILSIWDKKGGFPEQIETLLREHEQLVRSGNALGRRAEKIVAELQKAIADMSSDLDIPGNSPGTDMLPSLVLLLNEVSFAGQPSFDIEAVPPEETEIRRRELKMRRMAALHRPGGQRFRRAVRSAYRSTCIACGLYLPPLGRGSKPGVDAAHILPFAQFDMDHVSNGLCLCKLHHWAFDEGLIEITFNGSEYLLSVPQSAAERAAEEDERFDLEFLRGIEGPIPNDRLPAKHSFWPNPECLAKLKEILDS